MAKQRFEFIRLVESERRVGPTLASVSRHWGEAEQCFLFLSPHDDDAVIGAGLMILAALGEGVPVHVAVVTDGAMGYCSMAEKGRISEIRRKETFAAYGLLGVKKENIYWIGYPDCQLTRYQGRVPAEEGDPAMSHGFTGLQNTFTELLRAVRPTQVFLPTSADLHSDHRIVHAELVISCFHAAGAIWPELGEPLERPPYLHEMAVYCNFPTLPQLQLRAPMAAFEKKLEAIAQFKSQRQIKALVRIIERSGPLEYLRPVEFALYNSSVYQHMFEEPVPVHRVSR